MDHPDTLKFTHWDKKKGSLAAGSEFVGLLKALQKRHEGVPWKLFDPAWARSAGSEADLQEAVARRDRLARSDLLALKKEAVELAGAAARVARDKAAGKPALDAAKAIGAAAKAYAGDIDAVIDGLKVQHDKARAALPASASEDEASSVLLDPKQLLKWLKVCRRDPERRIQFAYVDGKETRAPVLAMSPRMSARKVFATLQAETGGKTGAFGTAWIAERSLMLKVDKPLAGLVKKVRVPLRAAGFRIAKVVLWRDDGTLFEQDEDAADAGPDVDGGDDAEADAYADPHADADEGAGADGAAPTPDPISLRTGAAQDSAVPVAELPDAAADDATASVAREPAEARPAPDAEAAFTARLKSILPMLATAGAAVAGPAKRLLGEAGAQARRRDWVGADSTLRRAEDLLATTTPPAPAVAGAAAASGRFVHQAKVRLGWQMARQKLAADLKALEAAILDHYRRQPEYAALASRVRRFDAVLDTLDDQLADKLDEALNAADPQQRALLHEQARAILAGYARYVRNEPLIEALDDNPFVPLSTHKALLKTLQVLDNSLA